MRHIVPIEWKRAIVAVTTPLLGPDRCPRFEVSGADACIEMDDYDGAFSRLPAMADRDFDSSRTRAATSEGSRELLITKGKSESDDMLVAVRDSCPGLAPAALEHLFKAFHMTKPNGLGLGLSICRSIIEGHGGRLWASANSPRGAVFQFTLPISQDVSAPQ
jgi:hypothetical protein